MSFCMTHHQRLDIEEHDHLQKRKDVDTKTLTSSPRLACKSGQRVAGYQRALPGENFGYSAASHVSNPQVHTDQQATTSTEVPQQRRASLRTDTCSISRLNTWISLQFAVRTMPCKYGHTQFSCEDLAMENPGHGAGFHHVRSMSWNRLNRKAFASLP